jgi:membrane-associated phospholipid phosphatase
VNGLLLTFAVAAVVPGAAAAQHGSALVAPDTGFHRIEWYEVLAVAGGSATLIAVDKPVERLFQNHRSSTTDDVASGFRQWGDARVALAATAGVTLAGVVVHDDAVRDAGLRAAGSVAVGAVATEILKFGLGRGRPAAFASATDFRPFTSEHDSLNIESRGSFPSGHSMIAFALATSLADDIHDRAATVALYSVATGTALSRLNDNRHWLSDVVAGAAIGVTSARLTSGRWRVFGLRPPHFLLSSGSAAISWQEPLTF